MNKQDDPLFSFRKFNIGKFSFLYKDCFIRKICYSNEEIIRGIYPAVRDRNWGTVPVRVLNSDIIQGEGELRIKENITFDEGEIHYQAAIEISFTIDGRLKYGFSGKANSGFLKNRIGLNLLLPIENTAGKHFQVKHSNGWDEGVFPLNIMPTQPIKDIEALSWKENSAVGIKFSGDIFEMEDQRNWTDASFKIYSTPIELPFPVFIEKGAKTDQLIEAKFSCNTRDILQTSENKPPTLFKIPKIGICLNDTFLSGNEKFYNTLKEINPDFINYAIDFEDRDSTYFLNKILIFAKTIDIKIKLSIRISETTNTVNIFILKKLIKCYFSCLHSIEIFNRKNFISEGKAVYLIFEELKKAFPSLLTGGGTYAYYAELNRSALKDEIFDFVNFSVSPQVHAIDKLSIVENIKGLEYAAKDAVSKYNSSIHIGPISLKQRMNFVETETTSTGRKCALLIDERQYEVFGALWILGCIKAAAISGIAEITFFDAIPEHISRFFPFYQILREVLKNKTSKIAVTGLPLPEITDGFILDNEMWIWNYADTSVELNGVTWSENAQRFNFTTALWENKVEEIHLLPESLYRFCRVKG